MVTGEHSRDLRHAAQTARDLVREVGAVVRDLQGHVKTRDKGHGLGPVTEADYEAEHLLLEGLERHFPGDAILSEETRQQVVPNAEWLWCVDPIDGTREYSQGLPEYAVMIGLLFRGEPVAGAVGLPGVDKTFWGWSGGDALSDDGNPIRLAPLRDPTRAIAVHTRSHMGPTLRQALETLGIQRTLAAGSVGYKVGQILQGNAHLYLHTSPGTMWWDSVGPAAVLAAAGGEYGNGYGGPVDYTGVPHHAYGLLFTVPGLLAPTAEKLRLG